MSRLTRWLTAVIVASAPLSLPAQQADRFSGHWNGSLHVGAATLRLQLTVRRDSSGSLTGAMKSIDQGGADMPGTVSARGDTISFVMAAQGAAFNGVLNAAADSIRGTFTQGSRVVPLVFVRSVGPTSSGRPQDPKPPFPYQTREVSFESAPGVRLAGTIDIPAGHGPFPAVVFVTGSGPQDRDEEIMGHRPFLVIADYLARHGIASLRYDDRGTAQSTGYFDASTTADFAVDAEAAVHYLEAQRGLASVVGIVGHSEGGLIGPMIAARSRNVGFLVLLAAPGVPDDSLTLLQQRARILALGERPEQAARGSDIARRLIEAVRGASDSAQAAERVAAAKRQVLSSFPEDRRAAASKQIDQMFPQLLSPWMRYFLSYDTRGALRKVRVPVLALGGSLDTNVPAKENLAGIDTALMQAGNRDYRVVSFPGLNHLFQPATTGLPNEFATIETTVDPPVLELTGTWINQRFGRR